MENRSKGGWVVGVWVSMAWLEKAADLDQMALSRLGCQSKPQAIQGKALGLVRASRLNAGVGKDFDTGNSQG